MASGIIKEGTKVHVRITGIVKNEANRSSGATTYVQGEPSGNHYLYLDSPRVKRAGDQVFAEFDAVTGPYGMGPIGTTQVIEKDDNGLGSFIHYVYLAIVGVTVIEDEKPKPPAEKKRSTVKISRDDSSINSDDVASRIAELEDDQGYDVVRLRTGEVLSTFEDSVSAAQFISDEDYNPARVIVRQQELSADLLDELESLRMLQDAVGAESWSIYNEDYFDEDWARDEALDQLGISYSNRSKLDEWPFDLIAWQDAADDRRDAIYDQTYIFNGGTFYGNE